MSTENGPKSVATEGPKNQENPKHWKKRTKIITRGGVPKHQTQDEEETAIIKIRWYFGLQGKHPAGEQQDRSGNQTANPLVNEALRDKQQRKKTYNAKNKKEKKKREQKKKINNHKNKKILRTTSNNRQANNKIEVQNRLWIPL